MLVAFCRSRTNKHTVHNNSIFLTAFFSFANNPETSATLVLTGVADWSLAFYRDPFEIQKATKII